jgi:hypothetical protein
VLFVAKAPAWLQRVVKAWPKIARIRWEDAGLSETNACPTFRWGARKPPMEDNDPWETTQSCIVSSTRRWGGSHVSSLHARESR